MIKLCRGLSDHLMDESGWKGGKDEDRYTYDVLVRLPCYDFTPVTGSTFDSSLQKVGSLASGISDSHGVTGGVYKTRERIHRDILIRDY